ncbi:MAG: hypothetical protein AAGC68_16875, partial [Verrucomicrobiota bacterium]
LLACGIWPTLFAAWSLARGQASWSIEWSWMIFLAIGWLSFGLRGEAPKIWAKLAFVGSISYGIYILQRPVQWFVLDLGMLPSGSLGSFSLRLLLVISITVLLSWLTDRVLQPKLKTLLVPQKQVP